MKKTDIAELVTEQLKQEFERQQKANEQHSESLKDCLHPMPLPEAKPRPTPEEVLALEKLRRWHLSFQEKRMAFEDAAGMLLGHKVKPLPEAKPTPEDEFKIERLSWWLFLFEGRIALGDAAGLLLGFSWTMTKYAKFVDAHESNLRAPRLMSKDLVDAFTDVRGDVEVALQKKELFSDRDGRINSIDLIEWAKEKDFVADEVLNAWEAYNKAGAGGQAEAVSSVPDYGLLATRYQLIKAFGNFTGMDDSWFRNVKDFPALDVARIGRGQGGRGHIVEPMFCPYLVMQWLMKKPRKGSRRQAFKTNEKPWQLLKGHFPKVYAQHQGDSPLED